MIPLWAISGIAAAAAAGLIGWKAGSAIEGAKLERERAAWANERTKAAERSEQALRSEIEAHNRTRTELEANHADAEARRAVAEKAADAADARASAAGRSERRVRDAIATDRLAAHASNQAAGTAAVCAAETQAADLYADLLGRYRERARSLGEAGRGISRFAEGESAAASECAGFVEAVSRGGAAP